MFFGAEGTRANPQGATYPANAADQSRFRIECAGDTRELSPALWVPPKIYRKSLKVNCWFFFVSATSARNLGRRFLGTSPCAKCLRVMGGRILFTKRQADCGQEGSEAPAIGASHVTHRVVGRPSGQAGNYTSRQLALESAVADNRASRQRLLVHVGISRCISNLASGAKPACSQSFADGGRQMAFSIASLSHCSRFFCGAADGNFPGPDAIRASRSDTSIEF